MEMFQPKTTNQFAPNRLQHCADIMLKSEGVTSDVAWFLRTRSAKSDEGKFGYKTGLTCVIDFMNGPWLYFDLV